MLLDEIIALAIDDRQPITTLLRKCVVLAHQIKNDRLKRWAERRIEWLQLPRMIFLSIESFQQRQRGFS